MPSPTSPTSALDGLDDAVDLATTRSTRSRSPHRLRRRRRRSPAARRSSRSSARSRDCGRTDSPGRARRAAPSVKSAASDRALGLVLDVGAEVPGHRLQPRHRVRRGPRLDLVVGVLQARAPRTRTTRRRRRGRRGRRSRPRRRRRSSRGSVGSSASTSCSAISRQPSVRRNLSVASCDSPNSSETRPARHVAAEVHLPEPVLRVHVALREEQVVGVVGGDRRDAEHVALHGRRRSPSPSTAIVPLELRERALDRPDDEARGDERDDDDAGDDAEQRDADRRGRRSASRGCSASADRRGRGDGLRH